jgi:hypothetical protein
MGETSEPGSGSNPWLARFSAVESRDWLGEEGKDILWGCRPIHARGNTPDVGREIVGSNPAANNKFYFHMHTGQTRPL